MMSFLLQLVADNIWSTRSCMTEYEEYTNLNIWVSNLQINCYFSENITADHYRTNEYADLLSFKGPENIVRVIWSWTHYFLTKSEQFWLFHLKYFRFAFFPWALHTDLMWVGSVFGLLSGRPGSKSSLHADRQRYSAALGKDKENEPTDLKALGGHALPPEIKYVHNNHT